MRSGLVLIKGKPSNGPRTQFRFPTKINKFVFKKERLLNNLEHLPTKPFFSVETDTIRYLPIVSTTTLTHFLTNQNANPSKTHQNKVKNENEN